MTVAIISAPEDREWLQDVHLVTCKRLPPFALAIVNGNEDWPTSIVLYETDHVNSVTMELRPDANGIFHCATDRY